MQGNCYVGTRQTRFACVRYGNVVGSRGSVIPLFLRAARDRQLTVTDPRMTRFWITLEQGVDFVIALRRADAGRRGVRPEDPEHEHRRPRAARSRRTARSNVIGIRPGEKLHEVLITEDEARNTLEFDDMYRHRSRSSRGGKRERWRAAGAAPTGSASAATRNDRWLTVDELRDDDREWLTTPGHRRRTPVRAALLPYGRQTIDEDDVRAVRRGAAVGLAHDRAASRRRSSEAFAAPVGARSRRRRSRNGTAALHAAVHAAGTRVRATR